MNFKLHNQPTLPASFLKSLLLVLFFALGLSKMNAQVSSNYGFQELAGPTYADLPANLKTPLIPGATPTASWTTGVVSTPIGFNFLFNGASYSTTYVSANGFITFGAAPAALTTQPISNIATGETGAISGYGADLGIGGTIYDATYGSIQANNVSQLVTGAAPNRISKIEYRLVRRVAGTSDTPISFQIWLHETTNIIEIHYAPTTVAFTNTVAGQVGLRGASIGDFNNRLILAASPGDWPTLPATTQSGTLNSHQVRTFAGYTIPVGSNRLFRWRPVNCTSPPGTVAISNVLGNSATATWSTSTPAPVQYDWEIRTSGAGGSGGIGLTNSGSVTHPTATVNITGLTANTSYIVYIRANCGPDGNSTWIASASFTTLCAALPDPLITPYMQVFDGPVVPVGAGLSTTTLPTCTTKQTISPSNPWVISTADNYPTSNMDGNILMYNGQSPASGITANAWFFTEGMQLTANQTYSLSYLYGGISSPSSITNSLQVAYGNFPLAGAMTVLDSHPNIKNSAFNNIVNFTPTVSGVYFFGFHAISTQNQAQMFVDDVQVVPSNCRVPTGLVVPAGLVTSNSALASWTAPSPAPAGGYVYYLSTSPTAPGNNTAPTNSSPSTVTTLSSLAPSTTYYLWVRGNCGGGTFSEWSSSVSFTTGIAPPTYCTPTGTGFQDPNGITNVTMGSINNPTGVEPGNYGNYSGLTTNVAQGATINVNITLGTGFTYFTNIWIDWNNDGDFADAGELVYTGESGNTVPTTLAASFVVPIGQPLGPRRLRIGSIDDPVFTGGTLTPCRSGAYQAYEDYTVNVVVAPPALTLSSAGNTQCAGTNSPTITLVAGSTSFDVYSWSPSGGVTGNQTTGYTFNNTSTQTYILTATQTSGSFSSNTVSYTYTANDVPTPITIAAPLGTVYCPSSPGTPLQLTASGGVVSNVTIFSETFNSGIGTFTQTNNSSGGASPLAAPVWTARSSPYTTPGFFSTTISSNDNSGYMLTNSDAQGGSPAPSITRTTLVSPVINLTGYTAASLSFYHYFRWIRTADIAQVEVTTDLTGTTGWTAIKSYTGTVGTPTNFVFDQINLNAYVNQSILIRYRYESNYGWWWAVDNFRISGSAASSIIWSPTTNVFSDAAGTVPYTGVGANTVYVRPPLAGATYTATASTPGPTVCTATANVSVTSVNIVAGTATGNQTICSGTPTALTLTGFVGTVNRWQWSSTIGFAAPNNIAGSNSATLLPAQMGVLTETRYYRAVIGVGACEVFSNIITVTYNVTRFAGTWSNGLPTATKAAVFEDDFTSSGNLTACSVLIDGGNVQFLANHSLIIQNELTVSAGSIDFASSSSLVQVNNAAVNTGAITYRRNTTAMRLYDYTYWSSPLFPQTLVGLSPLTQSDKYYKFDTGLNDYVNVPSNTLMDPAKGYIVRSPENFTATPQIFNGIFTGGAANNGVPNNGIKTIPAYDFGGTNNLNLIGNPYPSAIDADLLLAPLGPNGSVLNGTIYFWTHNTPIDPLQYTASDYAIYNLSGGAGTAPGGGTGNTATPDGNIAAGQAFFAEAINGGGTVTFNNSMRLVGSNGLFFRQSDAALPQTFERHRVWLELKNSQGAYKQILVGYIQDATNGLDRSFDGGTMDGGNVVGLYSILDSHKLGIQGRTLPFDVNDLVPLGYKSDIAGNFEIALSNFDGLFANQNVYLEDKLLNIIHNLTGSSYSFSTAIGTFDDRFVLRFTDGISLGIDTPVFNENSVIVIKENNSIRINSSNMEMAGVKIFDIRGRLLAQKSDINDNQTVMANLNFASGVLLVQITATDGQVVTKKIGY